MADEAWANEPSPSTWSTRPLRSCSPRHRWHVQRRLGPWRSHRDGDGFARDNGICVRIGAGCLDAAPSESDAPRRSIHGAACQLGCGANEQPRPPAATSDPQSPSVSNSRRRHPLLPGVARLASSTVRPRGMFVRPPPIERLAAHAPSDGRAVRAAQATRRARFVTPAGRPGRTPLPGEESR